MSHNDGLYILLPVRLRNPKTRLSQILSLVERSKLTLLMLDDVIQALDDFPNVFVVTRDEPIISFVEKKGVKIIRAEKGDLNSDLEYAQSWCIDSGAKSLLIVLPDLPALTFEDVTSIVKMSAVSTTSVIIPSKDGGTNMLLLKPCNLIKPSFGKNSFNRHVKELRKASINFKIYLSKGTRLDVDTIDDIRDLIEIKDKLTRVPSSLTNLEKFFRKFLNNKFGC